MDYLELIKLQRKHKFSKFISVIKNVVALFSSETAQFSEQVRIGLISELIQGISRSLQKLPKYYNDTAIPTFIVLALLVLLKILDLNLNDTESVEGFFGSSRQKIYNEHPYIFY